MRSQTIITRSVRVLYDLLGELLAYTVYHQDPDTSESGVDLDRLNYCEDSPPRQNMDSRLKQAGTVMEETSDKTTSTTKVPPTCTPSTSQHPQTSARTLTPLENQKLDMILANTQTIQAGQREMYNLLKALSPRMARLDTAGPTGHLEVVQLNKKQTDNPYLSGLIKRPKGKDYGNNK